MRYGDMLDMLDPGDRARIRRGGHAHTLALYRIAHEGVSGGAVVGIGYAPKRWTKARIEELAQAVDREKPPVYIGHSELHRTPVGAALKCIARDVGGITEALAVVHLTEPKAQEDALMKKLDAASIEADLCLEPEEGGFKVARIERVTGIALAGRGAANPGFPKAELIAAVRESAAGGEPDNLQQTENAAEDVQTTVEETLRGKNLSAAEKEYVRRRVWARVSPETGDEAVRRQAALCIDDLDEAKRIYRRPPARPQAPPDSCRGDLDYTNPEHNELIPM